MTTMSGIAALPGKVDHEVDEPAYALLVRTLEANNGRRGPGPALRRITGSSYQALSLLDPADVARICKADATAVEYATPIVRSKVATLMGQVLSAEHVSTASRRWCPSCMAEHPYHRAWWDIVPVTTCPEHGVELVASCGCEGRPLHWRTNSLRSCRNGHLLKDVVREAADPDALAMDAYVVGRLHGYGGMSSPDLDDLPLGDLLLICERLGKTSLHERGCIYKARRKYGTGRLHAEGFRILRDIPTNFVGLLDRLRADNASRPGREGLVKSYGQLYEFVRELPQHPLGEALRLSLFDHAGRHFAFGVRGRSKADLCSDPGITLTVAADTIGMPLERFRELLDQLGIPYWAEGKHYRTGMTLAAFEALRPRLEGFRSLAGVAGELGLSVRDVTDLADAGLLDLVAPGHGAAGWVFPAGTAETLLDALRERAAGQSGSRRGLRPIPRVARACSVSMAEVVTLVLDGSIAVRLAAGEFQGIPSLLVHPRNVADRFDQAGDPGPTLTVAARKLRLNQATLGAVLSAGLLRTSPAGGFIRVPASEIERFRTDYATMPELRKAMGTAAFQPVVAMLAGAGLGPAAAGPRSSDLIYPREAAMAACFAAARRRARAPERGANRKAVARELRVSVVMVRQLVDAGLLSMQAGCRFGSIATTEIARFKEAYVSAAELKDTFGKRWSVTVIGNLRKAAVEPVCSRPQFHFQLYPRAEAEGALRSLVEAEQVVTPEPPVDHEPTLGLADIAKLLDSAPNLINQVVRTGLMIPVKPIRVGHRTSVAVSEVERFSRTYVFANELGRLAGREQRHGTGNAVTGKLLRNGLRPVCSPPDYCGYLFDRIEAVAMMNRLGFSLGGVAK